MKKLFFWLQRFLTVYGIIMLSTFFMCLFANPNSQLPVVSFFGRCIVLTLLCLASLVVYCSGRELTRGGWWVRTILHTLLLEVMLLPLAHHWQFWYGRLDGIIYASFILAAKIVWHLVDYTVSASAAVQVNEQLRRRRHERKGEQNDTAD